MLCCVFSPPLTIVIVVNFVLGTFPMMDGIIWAFKRAFLCFLALCLCLLWLLLYSDQFAKFQASYHFFFVIPMSQEGSEPPKSNEDAPPPTSGTPDASAPGSSPGSSSGASAPGSNADAPAPGSSPDTGASGVSGTPFDNEMTTAESGVPPGSSTPGSATPGVDAPGSNAPGSNAQGSSAPDSSANTPASDVPSRTGTKSSTKSGRRGGGQLNMESCRIGFLGAGKLTEAIVKGLVQYSKIQPNRIFVTSKSGRTLDQFKQTGCVVTKRSYDLFAKLDCHVVFIVVHGHVIRELFKAGGTRPLALTTNYIPNQRHPLILLSLVGGIPLADIKVVLLNPEHPEKYKLQMHRIMLNVSVAFGIGLGALDIEPDSKKCQPIVRDLLTSFAKIEYIPEANMDAACALGGNGLAFVHYFIGALSDGGVKMGLPKSLAVKLAAKTLRSAAASLLESGKHPSDLRDQCTSPSGPAIYGLNILDQKEAGSGIATAIEGAFKRVRELVDNTGR